MNNTIFTTKFKMSTILPLLILLSIMLLFTGCKKDNAELKQDLQTTLDALISGTITDNTYIYSMALKNEDIWDNIISQKLTSKTTYKIISTESSESNGTAKVKFISPDAYTMLQEAASEPDIIDVNLLLENIEIALDNKFQTVDFDVIIELKLIDGHWYLVPNEDLSNALSGGLIEKYFELGTNIIDDLAEEDEQ